MAISGVSGTIAHGEAVTISGSSFGTKSTAAPLKYDDFQSVTDGSQITTSSADGPTWLNNGGMGQTFNPVASSARLRSGTPFSVNMRSHWQPSGGSDPSACSVALTNLSITRGLVDAWHYFDMSSASGSDMNIKPWRFHPNDPNFSTTNVYYSFANPADDTQAFSRDGCLINAYFGSTGGSGDLAVTHLTNHWVHVQWLFDVGSGNGVEDGTGICTLWSDDGTIATFSRTGALDMLASPVTELNQIFVGNYVRSGDYTGDVYFHWETVYLDTSWARVEIGDNATYASCTHREIWVPSAWSSTEITATVNRGSFAADDDVYLFVVDSTNTASAGFAITLGDEAAGEDPATIGSFAPGALVGIL